MPIFLIWANSPPSSVDNSPRYPEKILAETEDYIIKTTNWGVTLKNLKHAGG